jgi:hypothetical protein
MPEQKNNQFRRDDLVRYKENKTMPWINGRVIIVQENTITLRLENEAVILLRKENLHRDVIRHRSE